jgi:hypothetical protein
MNMRILIVGLCAIAALVGCGEEGFVGASCETAGSTEQCGDGLVCDQIDNETLCLALCDKQEDCGADEDCNGVSKSNLKACHPKEDQPL